MFAHDAKTLSMAEEEAFLRYRCPFGWKYKDHLYRHEYKDETTRATTGDSIRGDTFLPYEAIFVTDGGIRKGTEELPNRVCLIVGNPNNV